MSSVEIACAGNVCDRRANRVTRMNDTDTEGIHYGPPVKGEEGRGDEIEKRKGGDRRGEERREDESEKRKGEERRGEMRREVVGKPRGSHDKL